MQDDPGDDGSICSEKTAPPEEFTTEVQPLRKGVLPLYCVDWHNVLQFFEEPFIRGPEKTALKQLLQKSRVVVISAVGSSRVRSTEKLMDKCLAPLRAAHPNLLSWRTVLQKTGPGGKVALALEKGCVAIVDDNGPIIKEAVLNDMLTFPIVTRHNRHSDYNGLLCSNFPAAVEAILQPGLLADP